MTTHHDIELYPHNQETYDKIIEAWKTQNRVATVQATGTGKTFLILKCLFTYPNVNKVVLAPSNHILDQLNNKVDELPNTTLLTYSKLSFMSEEDIKQLDTSVIVLDEFHRCGADQWGKGVGKLIELFSDAKILGASATPVRYLDGERDMSDELFDSNAITNLSLTEAIVKGILPMPTYVSALYTFDEEILNLKDKIDKSSNSDEEKTDMYMEVEQLKKQLNKSKGIPIILKKYLGDNTGKFIVFCRNKEHQREMKKIVINWFKKAKIGEQIDTYTVYSGKTTNKKVLEDFKLNKNNQNVRLLFTIDMLNEGLHVEDTDGVIFLRSTISPTLYYQQLGRAISVGNKEPYVFDFVNNFNSLGSGGFGSELSETIERENEQRKVEGREELSFDDFVIYDEMQDIESLFSELEGKLNDNWDTMYERYKSGERSEQGESLYTWISTQRHFYRRGVLTADRAERLEAINFIWDPYDETWINNFELLRHYEEKYGDCNVPKGYEINEVKLGNWTQKQRQLYKNNRLSQERIDKLNKIGFQWSIINNDSWGIKYYLLTQFYNKNGHCNAPKEYELDGIRLGTWPKVQKQLYRNNKLSQEQIDKLNSIGFQWTAGKNSWENNYNHLCNYYKSNGHCNIPFNYEVNDSKLGNWVSRQRQNYKNKKLSQEQIDKLNSIGIVWNLADTIWDNKWDTNYKLLLKYGENNGHYNVPFSCEIKGVNLGTWVSTQRKYYKNNKLTKDQINKLEAIGFQWSIGIGRPKQSKTQAS